MNFCSVSLVACFMYSPDNSVPKVTDNSYQNNRLCIITLIMYICKLLTYFVFIPNLVNPYRLALVRVLKLLVVSNLVLLGRG